MAKASTKETPPPKSPECRGLGARQVNLQVVQAVTSPAPGAVPGTGDTPLSEQGQCPASSTPGDAAG